ncbi:MAG: hypothetical protein QGG40_16870, partial [Myxococcota bacterium]|nr:hypothetical protein [Myxococcota bacterium]
GDYEGADYWVIAQVLVDGKKVGESRQLVTSATMAELGPTFTWIKAFASVSSTQGTVEIRVSKADTEWTEEVTLFTRAGEYRL